MNIELLPHNEKGYNELIDCLQNNQMVSINRATGTGKSFILLKYLYNNRNKRILYIAPTYPIIDQLVEEHMDELGINKSEFAKFDTCIYRNLLQKNMEDLSNKYDIIILDEYHRCGAKKWGEKVNKLLDIIKEKYPNTKVIGTTATEIRYLDHEKNMNNILFDGVCASTLTLSDAIVQGILPAPIYINTIYSITNEIENLLKKIKKKVYYRCDYLKFENELRNIYIECLDIIKNSKMEFNQDFLNNKKYLSFSSTIKKIKDDKKIIHKIFNNTKLNEFEVHSSMSKEHNKNTLKQFRSINEGTNILYSVNILNEGFHLKDISGIFMLRKTTSPIIYFQQLGRLLSYSGRKKQVIVYDMVNNIRNHHVIYELYSDVTKKAYELMITNPEEKEKYQDIIDKFKIVDFNSKIYERIDKIKNKLTKENLLIERFKTAILILENKVDANYIEREQAKEDIFLYTDLIDIESFARIKKLDIPKPEIFNLTIEEFSNYLNGQKNIKELKLYEIKKFDKKIRKYCLDNNKVPSLFSNNTEELSLANVLNTSFNSLSNKTKWIINEIVINNKEINIFDRLNYSYIAEIDNVPEFFKIVKLAISKKIPLSDRMLSLFKKYKIMSSSEISNYKSKGEKKLEKVRHKCLNEIYNLGEENALEKFFIDLKKFIEKNRFLPTENNGKELYFKGIIYEKLMKKYDLMDEFNKIMTIKKEVKDINNSFCVRNELLEYIDFIKHNGRYPMPIIEEEKELVESFGNIKLSKEEKKLLNDTISSIGKKQMMENANKAYIKYKTK